MTELELEMQDLTAQIKKMDCDGLFVPITETFVKGTLEALLLFYGGCAIEKTSGGERGALINAKSFYRKQKFDNLMRNVGADPAATYVSTVGESK